MTITVNNGGKSSLSCMLYLCNHLGIIRVVCGHKATDKICLPTVSLPPNAFSLSQSHLKMKIKIK